MNVEDDPGSEIRLGQQPNRPNYLRIISGGALSIDEEKLDDLSWKSSKAIPIDRIPNEIRNLISDMCMPKYVDPMEEAYDLLVPTAELGKLRLKFGLTSEIEDITLRRGRNNFYLRCYPSGAVRIGLKPWRKISTRKSNQQST